MKSLWVIKSARVYRLQAELIQSFRTALGDHDTMDNFVIEIVLENSARGYGEAAVATHITGEGYAQTEQALLKAMQWITGKDTRAYLRISHELHERWSMFPSVIAAIETALWDALSRSLNVPLWRMFGKKSRKLQTDITIVIADLKETQKTIRKYAKKGFKDFKVKIGRDFDLDVQRVLSVKDIVPRANIVLDANQGYGEQDTLRFIQALKRYRVVPALIEQPVHRDDYDGLCRVTRSTKIPVCADESARSIEEVAQIIKDRAADVINIKLMKFGIVQACEVARLAQAAGVQLMIGGMMESSLAMTTSAHVAAGIGSIKYIDLDTPFFIKGDVRRNPFLSMKGIYDLQNVKQGIGIIPDIKQAL